MWDRKDAALCGVLFTFNFIRDEFILFRLILGVLSESWLLLTTRSIELIDYDEPKT
jgi:hypothetical protein